MAETAGDSVNQSSIRAVDTSDTYAPKSKIRGDNFEEYEPLDEAKKLHINDVLVPQLDDAIIRVANMRKKQPCKCQSRARRVASDTVTYYGQFSIECEKSELDIAKSSIQHGLNQFGSIDCEEAQNLPALTKNLRDCLAERNEILKQKALLNTSQNDDSQRILRPKLKPAFIGPPSYTLPLLS